MGFACCEVLELVCRSLWWVEDSLKFFGNRSRNLVSILWISRVCEDICKGKLLS